MREMMTKNTSHNKQRMRKAPKAMSPGYMWKGTAEIGSAELYSMGVCGISS